MNPTTAAPDLTALFVKLEEISLKVGTLELNTLYADGIRLGLRQEKWAKISKIVSGVVALAVFIGMDMLPGDYAVILALLLSVVAFVVTMLGLRALGTSMMSAQTAVWAQRAEQAVREHSQAS